MPIYDAAACSAAGWNWFSDYATHYCPSGQSCPPPSSASFCALRCDSNSDCAGTSVPYCGRIGYWGNSDHWHCSSFKVCVPEKPSDSSCYQREAESFCTP